jgi:hypothetical protein
VLQYHANYAWVFEQAILSISWTKTILKMASSNINHSSSNTHV